MNKRLVFLVIAMVAAACGGSESAGPVDTASGGAPTTVAASPEGTQPPTTEAEASSGSPTVNLPGAIVLTIGDQNWEFEGSLCAFYNARPGEEGSEWNVSQTKDGLQVYVTEDSFGTSVTIADIANGGSPTLSWGAENEAVSLTVNGNDIVAEGTFTDETGGSSPTEGKLEATCASWYEG